MKRTRRVDRGPAAGQYLADIESVFSVEPCDKDEPLSSKLDPKASLCLGRDLDPDAALASVLVDPKWFGPRSLA